MFRYAVTIFVSAFLLFQVQPLIGRYILPWFGGGPSVWTTCMLFFQMLLLAGYLYAHWISEKLNVRRQVLLHASLLAASLLLLPIAPSDSWKPVSGQSPSLQILLLLLASVGGPYFLLSSTGPLMQRWFSRTSAGQSPYRLYSLSNIGSLLALLSYPVLFEPWLQLRQQVFSWSVLYVVYVAGAIWCAARLWTYTLVDAADTATNIAQADAAQPATGEEPAVPPTLSRLLLWLGLSGFASAMLLATTNQLCIDVATVPFLWILPLGLYLLTFIVCFDNPRWYDRRVFGIVLAACAPAVCRLLARHVEVAISDQIFVYSAALFACCMTCHGELVACRPHPKFLTKFYVAVSAGGALGGLFVAIVATHFFNGYWEYHISLVGCCLMTLIAWCAGQVWLKQLSPAFCIWTLAVAIQLSSVWYLIYRTDAAILQDADRTVFFGVYGILQAIGLMLTASSEKRNHRPYLFWAAMAIVQTVWLNGYAVWQFPQLVSLTEHIFVSLGAIVPAAISCLLYRIIQKLTDRTAQRVLFGGLAILAALIITAVWYAQWFVSWQIVSLAIVLVAAILLEWGSAAFGGPEHTSPGMWFWMPGCILVFVLGTQLTEIIRGNDRSSVFTTRNFYGVLRVRNDTVYGREDDGITAKFSLTHGQIQHGFQFVDDYWKEQPTTYYGPNSGVGLAIRACRTIAGATDQHPLRVGIVGLGTGTIASYGMPGDYFQFYEINPAVLALSDTYFSYLRDSKAETKVTIGDARIVMERELAEGQSQQFDVLAIDAFSSDAIPVHLLTSECGEIYKRHLRPGGVLAVHISNRFLDLNPVARGLGEHLGWQAFKIDDKNDDETGVYSSTWILLTSSEAFANDPEVTQSHDPWQENEKILNWTDDYSGLWRVLSF